MNAAALFLLHIALTLGRWQENNETHFHDTETGVELEVTDRQSLVEWIANNYKNFGATLEFITNRQATCASGRPLNVP